MNRKIKNSLLLLIKLLIAWALIYWTIQKGNLDFHFLGEFLKKHLGDWVLAFAMVTAISCFSSYRWKYILELKSRSHLSFLQVIKIHWIGLLFNPVLPGPASGDIVKIFYVKDMDNNLSTPYLFSSILIDRIFGLSALLLLSGFILLLFGNQLTLLTPEVEKLVFINGGLSLISFSFIIFLICPKKVQFFIKKMMEKVPWVGPVLANLLSHFWFIGGRKMSIPVCLLISMICQSGNFFVFWFLSSPYISSHLSLLEFTIIFPIGTLSQLIPITPLGLGVGHIAFNKLFAFYGVAGGANYFNLYIITHIMSDLLGIFPYLFSKKKLKLKQLDDLYATGRDARQKTATEAQKG